MSSIVYNGTIVNEAVSNISKLEDSFSSLSGSIKAATNKIISSRGYNEYIGGITSDSFSSYVDECGAAVGELVNFVRQKQITILAYSENKADINAFLDTLDRKDYASLDLSEIDSYISFGRKAGNFFKGIGADVATVGLGLAEGIMDFGETAADLVTLGGTMFASIFTKGYDLITGNDTTTKMWEQTKAVVSEKKVENIFNNLYSNTEIGQNIKNNAYQFDAVRGISKGLGYTAGLIGTNILTGGLASGLGVGAAGSIGAGQLAATAGLMGFSNGTEEAWADGATIGKGLAYGAASGAWEGAQWYLGAKINQYGGLGDRVASGIFKGAASGVGTRIAMDTIDSGVEGFVQPALTMIYKDYGGSSFQENYAKAFAAAGGWGNVLSQAAMGAFASAVGEFSGARKLLKENQKAAELDEARKVFASSLEAGEGDGAAMAAGDFSRSRKTTIDGNRIEGGDSFFTRKTASDIPSDYKLFTDGSYIPLDGANAGAFRQYEKVLSPAEAMQLIENNRGKMSGADYTALMKAAEIFQSDGVGVNLNELKLIVSHSEGNVGRIRSALILSGVSESSADSLATRLAKEVFPTSVLTQGESLKRALVDDYIDTMRKQSGDNWQSGARLLQNMDSDQLIRTLAADQATERMSRINQYFGGYLSSETTAKLMACDGYPSTIRTILEADGNIPSHMLDTLSVGSASKIFQPQNMARLKSVSEVCDYNLSKALQLTSSSGATFDGYTELLKATNLFGDPYSIRAGYYSVIDDLVANGMSLSDATRQTRLMSAYAMDTIGVDGPSILKNVSGNFTNQDMMYRWNNDLIERFEDVKRAGYTPEYIQKHYMTNGHFDGQRLVDDFKAVMGRQSDAYSDTVLGGQGFDVGKSVKATQLFTSSFADAAMDPNNPNRADAIRFMSKILEMDSQGKGVRILSNNGQSGSYCLGRDINLALYTLDGKQVETVFHESGHMIFNSSLNAQYPSNFDVVRRRAVSNLDSAGSQTLLRLYEENADEVRYYTQYLAGKQLDSAVRAKGYSGISGYRDWLTQEYSGQSASSRNATLQRRSVQGGMVTGGSYKGYSQNIDFNDAQLCANMQINQMRARAADTIFRSDFGNYATTSGIIDSASQGKVRYNYGHGASYFSGRSDPTLASYHELIADYSSLKLRGDQHTIGFLRFLMGNELFDMLDGTYRQMLK